jgi:hypothetical protein
VRDRGPVTETGPDVLAITAGSRKIPEPAILPITTAVAIHMPIERLSPDESA